MVCDRNSPATEEEETPGTLAMVYGQYLREMTAGETPTTPARVCDPHTSPERLVPATPVTVYGRHFPGMDTSMPTILVKVMDPYRWCNGTLQMQTAAILARVSAYMWGKGKCPFSRWLAITHCSFDKFDTECPAII